MSGPKIAVVGGGAAGMMAAATIAEERPDAAVTLFERNRRLGAKVIISGGGRCNVTTGLSDVPELLKRYPRGARWLRHAMYSFPPEQVSGWFEARGVPLKVEPDLRVFPESDNGHDIVAAFERVFAGAGVDVRLRSAVQSVQREDGMFFLTIAGEHRPAGPFDRLIITTGGSAFSQTGSAGDGFRFARALGHTVTPLAPSLGAYVVKEPWVRDLAGVSLADVVLEAPRRQGKGGPYRQRGALLFTHFGITGPAVFALNALAAFEPFDAANPLPLRLALLPEHSADQADILLRDRFTAMPGRGVANVLDTLLPRSLCPVLCALAEVEPSLPAARVPRAARQRLALLLSGLPLSAIGRRAGEEFVTAGGVALDQIDPRTMASRLVPGLFFAGEVLDVDGFTGGFNLQAAWSTGRLAGLAAGAESKEQAA